MSWRLLSCGKLGALAALAVSFSLHTTPATADAPTPTPTRTVLSATASAMPTASPTASPTPAATASPTATRPVATGTPTPTPSPTASLGATCTPEAAPASGAAMSPGCAATLQATAALITPVAHGTTPPVRSLPTAGVRAKGGPRRTVPIGRPKPVAPRARLQDTVVQSSAGPLAIPSAIQNFDGVGNVDGVEPPDTEGAVGPSHYVQWVNNSFAVWDKQGNQLKGPTEGNTLWASLSDPTSLCRTTNQGDPIVLYDRANDRWFMSQFAFTDVTTPPFHQCIAVSTSGDPTGSFKVWDFVVSTTAFNDYTKWGIGPDAYYASYNMFPVSGASPGAAAQAFNRAEMVSGIDNPHATALFQTTDNVLLPADQDGARSLAAGAPEPYVTIDRSGSNLVLYEFHVDWATPANSTFQKAQTLPTAPYISDLCGDTEVCIPQPGLGRTLEDNSDRPMYRLAYRNFGDHEAMVVNHTVDVDGSNHAGVRWYELRRSGGAWSIFQQGTYGPDANHRWMGSIAMDGAGNIALGYSVSGDTTFPSIRYTGRLAGDPLGVMTLGETSIIEGGDTLNFGNRWGDYSRMAIDPVDDRTFWYTQQYVANDGSNDWRTRIASFQLNPTASGPIVLPSTNFAVSPPLRTLATASLTAPTSPRSVPLGVYTKLPRRSGVRARDALLQAAKGVLALPSTIQSFDGLAFTRFNPPDTNGAVGPNHYVQWVNTQLAVWDKQGKRLMGPIDGNQVFATLGTGDICAANNNGDPIVLYDHMADRWFLTQFAIPGPQFRQCVAVSQTGDPTGAYNLYEFNFDNMAFNDYGKFGIWPDAYYASYNMFPGANASADLASTGLPDRSGAYVVVQAMPRAQMLAGTHPVQSVAFQLPDAGASGAFTLLPADLDGGPMPPPGAPEQFLGLDVTSTSRLLRYEFHVDFANPLNSTFTAAPSVNVAEFSYLCGGVQRCIDEPGAPRQIDTLGDRLMYRLAYRNFGDHEAMVVNHSVDVDGTDHAGIRWYELRRSGGAWSIYQQGTYAPDADHRWMGSIAMDRDGNIALGYSVSGASTFPSIRYTGRLSTDPLGVMTLIEGTVINGSAIQGPGNGSRFFERWGDYSRMAIDPVDDRTFWYTQQYIAAGRPLDANPSDGNTWSTRIAAFQFTQGITFSPALPTSLTYGAAPFTLGAVATSGQPVILGASGACRLSGNSVTTTGVGTCTVTANVLAAPGFAPASATQSIPVAPAPLQVSADNKSIVTGNPLPTFTASYSGFVNGDGPGVIQGTLVFTTSATSTSPAGAYPITVSGITAPNYTITFVPGTLTISNPPGGGGGGAPAPGTGTTITGTSSGTGQFSGSLDFSQLTGNAPTSSTGTFSASQGGSLSAGNVGLTFSPASLAGTNGPVIVSIQPAGTLSLTAPDCLAGAACGLIRQALRPTVPGGPFQYSPNGTLFQVTVTDQAGNAIRTFPSPVALLLKPNAADLAMARGDPKQLAVAYMVDEQTPAIANPLRFPVGTWVFFPPSAVTQDPATGNLLVQAQVLSGLISVFSHPVGYVQVLKDRAPLLSSFASDAQTFGRKPQWSYLQVVEPQIGERLLVQDPTSKNIAYVNAADVGPSGPPPAG